MIAINNPGNIRWFSGNHWQGLVGNRIGFCMFDTPHSGLRALAITLINYDLKHGDSTIDAIVDRYAPPSENDTYSYVTDVCAHMGCSQTFYFDLLLGDNLQKLMRAIVHHENGDDPYTDTQYVEAIYSARETLNV